MFPSVSRRHCLFLSSLLAMKWAAAVATCLHLGILLQSLYSSGTHLTESELYDLFWFYFWIINTTSKGRGRGEVCQCLCITIVTVRSFHWTHSHTATSIVFSVSRRCTDYGKSRGKNDDSFYSLQNRFIWREMPQRK